MSLQRLDADLIQNQDTMDQSYLANLSIFKSLFRGREDIFAIRLEKGGKATYIPAYEYDSYRILFERSYPAARSRKIIITLLERIGFFSTFDKNSSFDRLFPNQDSLSGKGFGNLIALPLNKICVDQGNNCFINPDTRDPYKDQWGFLKTIQRVPVSKLDKIYELITKSTELKKDGGNQPSLETGKIKIELDRTINITRSGLPLSLINFLKEELNFLSSEFIIKKKLGKNTWGSERYFRFIEEKDDHVIIPRGMAGRLLRFCRENNIENDFSDNKKKAEPVYFTMDVPLREHQKLAVAAVSKKDMGVIVAPPGTGKTIVGLKIIAEKQQPALIIVHRKQLADQWVERIKYHREAIFLLFVWVNSNTIPEV